MNKLTKIGQDIFSSTGELSIIASEISESSNSQNADVKESLATMEDSYSLSKNISSRITEVSGGTDNTKYEVSEAFYLLKENIEQLTEINTSNMEFKEGIDRLSKQIESVDDIVSIIKDIADQTKIIAFNAELEAISAGKEGQNFHIVSTEIRRLANNTMNSIDTIKEYITNVKQSSTSLLESSITNSYKITEEIATARELEQQFDQIKKSSNLTNSKSNEITSIIEQQTVSFNQIVITLRQISAGLESFTVSTKTINNAVEDMKNIAHKLSGIN
jgi:methyl-accepting chemotaxis protein